MKNHNILLLILTLILIQCKTKENIINDINKSNSNTEINLNPINNYPNYFDIIPKDAIVAIFDLKSLTKKSEIKSIYDFESTNSIRKLLENDKNSKLQKILFETNKYGIDFNSHVAYYQYNKIDTTFNNVVFGIKDINNFEKLLLKLNTNKEILNLGKFKYIEYNNFSGKSVIIWNNNFALLSLISIPYTYQSNFDTIDNNNDVPIEETNNNESANEEYIEDYQYNMKDFKINFDNLLNLKTNERFINDPKNFTFNANNSDIKMYNHITSNLLNIFNRYHYMNNVYSEIIDYFAGTYRYSYLNFEKDEIITNGYIFPNSEFKEDIEKYKIFDHKFNENLMNYINKNNYNILTSFNLNTSEMNVPATKLLDKMYEISINKIDEEMSFLTTEQINASAEIETSEATTTEINDEEELIIPEQNVIENEAEAISTYEDYHNDNSVEYDSVRETSAIYDSTYYVNKKNNLKENFDKAKYYTNKLLESINGSIIISFDNVEKKYNLVDITIDEFNPNKAKKIKMQTIDQVDYIYALYNNENELNEGKVVKVLSQGEEYGIDIKNVLDLGENLEYAIENNMIVNWYKDCWVSKIVKDTNWNYIPKLSLVFDIKDMMKFNNLLDELKRDFENKTELETIYTTQNGYTLYIKEFDANVYLKYNNDICIISTDSLVVQSLDNNGFAHNSIKNSDLAYKLQNANYTFVNLNLNDYQLHTNPLNNQMFAIFNDNNKFEKMEIEYKSIYENKMSIKMQTTEKNTLNDVLMMLDKMVSQIINIEEKNKK